jgi:hypothetical protein
MTTNTTTAEDCLAKLGIQLPDAPTPFGAYAASGCLPRRDRLFATQTVRRADQCATVEKNVAQ